MATDSESRWPPTDGVVAVVWTGMVVIQLVGLHLGSPEPSNWYLGFLIATAAALNHLSYVNNAG